MQPRNVLRPPQPLLEPTAAPEAYPIDALGEILGPAAQRLADVIGVPCAMAAQSVLATTALASQGHANVHLDGRTYPLSLYLLTIACSGDRKSAVDQTALSAARQWEREQWDVYAEKLQAYRAALKTKYSRNNMDEGADLLEPVQPRLIIAEPTVEALVKNLCHGFPSMGLFNDEGGQFLGGSTMSKENRLKTFSTLSTLWDGSPIDRARSMAGESLRAYDRRLSLHLMIQPFLAEELFKDPVINGQGLLGRCLISWPRRLAGQRMYVPIDLSTDPHLQRYHQRITALLQKPWPRNKDGSLNPARLELDELARELWIEVHNAIERESSEMGEFATISATAGKAAAYVLRIAGLLAVIERTDRVGEKHVRRAANLIEFYLTEAQRLTEREPCDVILEDADRLLRWLREKNWARFTLRELVRGGPRFARKSSRRTGKILGALIVNGWLRTPDAGKTYEVQHVSSA
ncbi:MAG: YfjI family protein [Pseudomonas sp.]